ncbi:phage tail tape measure protein [Pararhizobium mangrovi]|nr:phage tail tape measure protein [Pararhizobium mangrovi]
MDALERRSHSLGAALTGALEAATVRGRDFESVLKSLGQRLSAIALDAGLKPLEGMIGKAAGGLAGSLGSALGFARGGVPGRVTPFAEGGVVRSPTFFPAGGDLGLMGEAGSEAILPLLRGSDGRLGVASQAGGASAPPIVVNITTPDAGSFRKSEAQVTTMLARAVHRGRRGL